MRIKCLEFITMTDGIYKAQADKQAERWVGRQKDRQAGRQAGRQTDRQTDRQTVRQADKIICQSVDTWTQQQLHCIITFNHIENYLDIQPSLVQALAQVLELNSTEM